MEETAIHLLPKWRQVGDVADLLVARLAELSLNKEDSMVMDLLGNSCFMGSESEGMPAHAIKQTGTFHITGAMEGDLTVLMKKVIAVVGPMLQETVGVARLILLAPLPRYVGAKCCSEPDHNTNFSDDDYKTTIDSTVDNCKNVLKLEEARYANAVVIDPMEALTEIGGKICSSLGTSAWETPVHLTRAAYADVWGYIRAADSNNSANKLCYRAIINMPRDRRMLGADSALSGQDMGDGPRRPRSGQHGGRRDRNRFNPY